MARMNLAQFHPGDNVSLKCWEQGMPGFAVGLDRLSLVEVWEAGWHFRLQCTRAWEQDMRCIRESKQGDFVTKGHKSDS